MQKPSGTLTDYVSGINPHLDSLARANKDYALDDPALLASMQDAAQLYAYCKGLEGNALKVRSKLELNQRLFMLTAQPQSVVDARGSAQGLVVHDGLAGCIATDTDGVVKGCAISDIRWCSTLQTTKGVFYLPAYTQEWSHYAASTAGYIKRLKCKPSMDKDAYAVKIIDAKGMPLSSNQYLSCGLWYLIIDLNNPQKSKADLLSKKEYSDLVSDIIN